MSGAHYAPQYQSLGARAYNFSSSPVMGQAAQEKERKPWKKELSVSENTKKEGEQSSFDYKKPYPECEVSAWISRAKIQTLLWDGRSKSALGALRRHLSRYILQEPVSDAKAVRLLDSLRVVLHCNEAQFLIGIITSACLQHKQGWS